MTVAGDGFYFQIIVKTPYAFFATVTGLFIATKWRIAVTAGIIYRDLARADLFGDRSRMIHII
mgnify:CR=1 FL=1